MADTQNNTSGDSGDVNTSQVNVNVDVDLLLLHGDTIPIFASCCLISGINLNPGHCLGVKGACSKLCCVQEYMCCKPGRNVDECILLQRASTSLVHPETCCEGLHQVCCCETSMMCLDFENCSILDPEFPCLVNCCGITLIYNCIITPLFCANMGRIIDIGSKPSFRKVDSIFHRSNTPSKLKTQPSVRIFHRVNSVPDQFSMMGMYYNK